MNARNVWSLIGRLLCCVVLLTLLAPQAAQAQSASGFMGIQITPTTFSEAAGEQAATGTLTRSFGDNTVDAVVTLNNSDPTRISVPATVTIPAGQTTATFNVAAIDNNVVDATNTVSITPSAAGYGAGVIRVTVTDDEAVVTLSIAPPLIDEGAGANAATATVTRSAAAAAAAESDLTLEIRSSDTDTITAPESVTLLKGQTTATFALSAVDNNEFDAVREVEILVRLPGAFTNLATATIRVEDDETRLTLIVSRATVSEAGGSQVTNLTIRRSGGAAEAGPANIALESSDTSELTVPPYVFMPEGTTTRTIALAAINDTLVDGPQRVTIFAQAAEAAAAQGTVEVVVTDNDTPQLTLDFNSTAATESTGGGVVIGTVTRNTEINAPLTVLLRSSDTSELVVPVAVTIPARAVSANFFVRPMDDTLRDGTQRVTVSVSQSTFTGDAASIDILDNEGPTLRVAIAARQAQENASEVRGTVFRTGPLGAAQMVTLTSSNTAAVRFKEIRNDKEVVVSTLMVTIPANSASADFILVTVDNKVPEDVQNATIIASAKNMNSGAGTLRVTDDDDEAILTLSVKSLVPYVRPCTVGQDADFPKGIVAFPESAGTFAAIVTLTRNTATTSEIVAAVTPGNTGSVRTPRYAAIPVGVRSVTFIISAVDDEDADGFCDTNINNKIFNINASVPGFSSLPSGGVPVNLGQDDLCLGRGLSVQITDNSAERPPAFPSEEQDVERPEADNSSAATVWVTRTDFENNYDLVVDLVVSNPDAANIVGATADTPYRVVVPAITPDKCGVGRTWIRLSLATFENQRYEGCVTVNITPVAVGFIPKGARPSTANIIQVGDVGNGASYIIGSDNIRINDNETIIESVTVRPGTLNETGSLGVATGVVTRRGPTDSSLEVIIRTTDPSEIMLGSTNDQETLQVTIPAGKSSANFGINAVDDLQVDGTQPVVLEAKESDECYTTFTPVTINVRDDDLPTLSLDIAPKSLVEIQGSKAATATLKRNTPTTKSLTVKLVSTDTTEATVPATVTIPAGKDEVQFPVTAVNDKIADGSQRLRIEANSHGYRVARSDIVVLDSQQPTLTLNLTPGTFAENAGAKAAQATLLRNTPNASAMTVMLSSSNPGLVRVPTTVTLPAGSSAAKFMVQVIDNATVEGSRSVTITASKNGFASSTATALVLDDDTAVVAARQSTSAVKISIASIAGDKVRLSFSGALDASTATDAAHYAVSRAGTLLDVESVAYDALSHTITLGLASGAVRSGQTLTVLWNDVSDSTGKAFSGQTIVYVP
jgi:hypothetical protein